MKYKIWILSTILIMAGSLVIALAKYNIIQVSFNMPKKPTNTTLATLKSNISTAQNEEMAISSELFRCKQENIDGKNFDVFEGWSDFLYSSREKSKEKFAIYNIRLTEKDEYVSINSDFSKVYIIEDGVERKLDYYDYDLNDEELWNFKVYYKIVAIDDSLKDVCPGWDGDLANSYIYKIVLQKPTVKENQSIVSNLWKCFKYNYIKLQYQNNWVITEDKTYDDGCNIKFANRSNYSYIDECNFLDPSFINSMRIDGDFACSKFNDSCFFYAREFYFDTKLAIDDDTNISFNNFVYNTKDFTNDTKDFFLRNYNLNNYWKTGQKNIANKYYLQPYSLSDINRCDFYWSSLFFDITDNISSNSSLAYLINKIEKQQVDSGSKNTVFERDNIPLVLNAKGTLYCGRLINFMANVHDYSCILKPDIVNIVNMNY